MPYRFVKRYRSAFGHWLAGDVADFDAETAAWLLRDEPGCIEPVEPEPETRAVETPPHDRQIKAAPRKRGVQKGGA